MAARVSLGRKLAAVLVPTSVQVFAALVVAAGVLLAAHTQTLLPRLGITDQAIAYQQGNFHGQFDTLLRSPIASNAALMTFWALVGLVAYLVCWGLYNVMIEARNQVTLTTAYTNRGPMHAAFTGLIVKACAAAGLFVLLSTFLRGVSIWLAFSAPVITDTTVTNAAYALAAVVGLALQLYLLLVFIQLTFTPWYRAESLPAA
jgi:hypothetical protein